MQLIIRESSSERPGFQSPREIRKRLTQNPQVKQATPDRFILVDPEGRRHSVDLSLWPATRTDVFIGILFKGRDAKKVGTRQLPTRQLR